jgi:hypothetical protein
MTASAVPAIDMASVSINGRTQCCQREKSGGTISLANCPSAGRPSISRWASKKPVIQSEAMQARTMTATRPACRRAECRSSARMVS